MNVDGETRYFGTYSGKLCKEMQQGPCLSLCHGQDSFSSCDVAIRELWWKKLFLFPLVLFSRMSKTKLRSHIQMLLNDKWSFKLSDFPAKVVIYNRRNLVATAASVNEDLYADDVSKFSKLHQQVHVSVIAISLLVNIFMMSDAICNMIVGVTDAIPKLTSLLCIWFMVVQRMLIAIIFIQLWLLNWIACVSLLVYGVQENLGMHFEKIFLKINVGRISQSSIRNADALDSASNVIHIGATITSSLEGSEMYQPVPLSVKKAQQKGHRAEEAYKKKINKYQGIWEEGRRENPEDAVAVRPEIVPFVLESTGLFHEKSLEFLQKVADLANQTQKIGNDSMMKYFVKRVGFAFQNAVGTAINLHSRALLGHHDNPTTSTEN
jgi:hypothetical protein